MGDDTNIGEYEITFTVPNNGFKKILKNETTNYDQILHPDYYTDGNIEVIDFIEDKKLGFCLGNVVKYVSRAGKKDPSKEVEDLKKARWYLNRRIEEVIAENENE